MFGVAVGTRRGGRDRQGSVHDGTQGSLGETARGARGHFKTTGCVDSWKLQEDKSRWEEMEWGQASSEYLLTLTAVRARVGCEARNDGQTRALYIRIEINIDRKKSCFHQS
ncbi:hypothetical protein RRG08_060701 [Elysia crispata]|uniref:Uncharacterized protein n=1 Tax=Elysia crispata TaxID=231223 RepID=A0AAE0YSW5_9GAST|nr:hypothetical protein RRG08_060701 [Elysia crispata]